MDAKMLQELLLLNSEKVRAMYEAVNELVAEGRSPNSLKVSDITNRAGIGKGTAYDYFQSKEELIAKAILYNIGKSICGMMQCVKRENCFKDKIYAVLNSIEKNFQTRRSWMQYLCFHVQSISVRQEYLEHNPKTQECDLGIRKFARELMLQACEEKLIPRPVSDYRILAGLFPQVLAFWYYLDQTGDRGEVTVEEAKATAYQNILKLWC